MDGNDDNTHAFKKQIQAKKTRRFYKTRKCRKTANGFNYKLSYLKSRKKVRRNKRSKTTVVSTRNKNVTQQQLFSMRIKT